MFDTSRLTLRSAEHRKSFVHARDAKQGLEGVPPLFDSAIGLGTVARFLKTRSGPAVWFFGGAVFKANVGWYLKELEEWMDHRATNGAGLVHSWEMHRLGHTSECVPDAIKDGSFGMWTETSEINKAIANTPWGTGIGAVFAYPKAPPITVHVSVGQDIFHMHPNYDARAWGQAAYTDFLKFASVVEGMQGGTFLVFGSAVCAPEVFLKALGMARNVNKGKPDDIAVAVFDCVAPPEDPDARWFHRPSKNLMDRCASQSVFVKGRHEVTIPNLWRLLCAQ